MGDRRFGDEQLKQWRCAEAAAGLAKPKPTPKAKARPTGLPTPASPSDEFVASKGFMGSWAGWSYRTGQHGTGYYRNRVAGTSGSVVGSALNLDQLIPRHSCTQALMADASA